MKQKPCLYLIALLAFTVPFTGCRKADNPPEDESATAPVKVVHARNDDPLAEWTALTGVTQPLPGRLARITAPIEGRVEWVLVMDGKGKEKAIVEGQRVEKDAVVVQLDDRVAVANRDKLLAALDEFKESIKQAGYACELAQLEVDRLKKLESVVGAVGTQTPLVAPVEIKKADISLLDAQSKLAAMVHREKSLQADLAAAVAQLTLYKLRAPIAGFLGTVQVVPGQTLTPGTVVADVIDTNEIDVAVFAAPHTAQKLQLKQEAYLVRNDDAPALAEVKGEIVYVARQAQPDTGNFLVKVRFPNKDVNLKANQVVNLQVKTQEMMKRWMVPEAVLMEDQDPPAVVIAEHVPALDAKNNPILDKIGRPVMKMKARRLNVTLGARVAVSDLEQLVRMVEILKLEDPVKHEEVSIEGTRFIIEGGHGLADGDDLKFAEEEEE